MIETVQLHVRDGELVADAAESWVYVWLLAAAEHCGSEVMYVGATGLPPVLATYLQLTSEDREVGRVRAKFKHLESEPMNVKAFRVPVGIERAAVKHALVNELAQAGRLADGYVGPEPSSHQHSAEVTSYVREVIPQLG